MKCLKCQQQSHIKSLFHTKSKSLHCISLYCFYLGMTFLPYIYNLHLKTHCIPRISHNHFLLKFTFTWCYQLIWRGWIDHLFFGIHVVDICGFINVDFFFFKWKEDKETENWIHLAGVYQRLKSGFHTSLPTIQYFLWLGFYSAEWFHKHKH